MYSVLFPFYLPITPTAEPQPFHRSGYQYKPQKSPARIPLPETAPQEEAKQTTKSKVPVGIA
jgi:hypothetical protein